jgi:hypothetical protein
MWTKEFVKQKQVQSPDQISAAGPTRVHSSPTPRPTQLAAVFDCLSSRAQRSLKIFWSFSRFGEAMQDTPPWRLAELGQVVSPQCWDTMYSLIRRERSKRT